MSASPELLPDDPSRGWPGKQGGAAAARVAGERHGSDGEQQRLGKPAGLPPRIETVLLLGGGVDGGEGLMSERDAGAAEGMERRQRRSGETMR